MARPRAPIVGTTGQDGLPTPTDLVVGSGFGMSLRRVTEVAFARLGLDYREHVDPAPRLERLVEAEISGALW